MVSWARTTAAVARKKVNNFILVGLVEVFFGFNREK